VLRREPVLNRVSTSAHLDLRRQERARRILDAAVALILLWGYNQTAIDDVARQAGVAKGTIYLLYWKTRENLCGIEHGAEPGEPEAVLLAGGPALAWTLLAITVEDRGILGPLWRDAAWR